MLKITLHCFCLTMAVNFPFVTSTTSNPPNIFHSQALLILKSLSSHSFCFHSASFFFYCFTQAFFSAFFICFVSMLLLQLLLSVLSFLGRFFRGRRMFHFYYYYFFFLISLLFNYKGNLGILKTLVGAKINKNEIFVSEFNLMKKCNCIYFFFFFFF